VNRSAPGELQARSRPMAATVGSFPVNFEDTVKTGGPIRKIGFDVVVQSGNAEG
jgi:hypothetical protein